jgi:hypothetical protein
MYKGVTYKREISSKIQTFRQAQYYHVQTQAFPPKVPRPRLRDFPPLSGARKTRLVKKTNEKWFIKNL